MNETKAFITQLCGTIKHNCPHFEKEDNMNETEAFITQLCGTIIVNTADSMGHC